MSRAYGWTTTGHIIDDEAAIIRSSAADIIGGATVTSIVNRLNDDGVPTATGRPWSIVALSRMLRNPRMAGRRDVDGTLVESGIAPILDDATWQQVLDVLTDESRGKYVRRRRPPSIATGLFVCGVCGKRAHARPKGEVVALVPDCADVSLTLDAAVAELTERVLARITSPTWLAAVSAAVDAGADRYRSQIADADERMRVLAEQFGAGAGEQAALAAGVDAARRVRDEASDALAVIAVADGLPALTDVEVVKWWALASVAEQRAVVDLVVDRVEILPLKESIDRDRLRFHWR